MVSNRAKNKHVALIVEDDLNLAEALGDLLKSLGHDFIHAETQEEGLRLMEEGQFCFAILDLQIKVDADAIYPMVEAGAQLQRQIRDRYPNRNDNDQHHLQILAMSGHAKEMFNVIGMLQNGADDFILKPLGENNPPLHVKIQECLQKSGRENHADCAHIMELARGKPSRSNSRPVAPKRKTERSDISLTIPGQIEGKRTEVAINGVSQHLPDAQLLLLMRMVAGRAQDDSGWVHKQDLGSRDADGFKGMSNLNSSLKPLLPGGMSFYENDKMGSYRIKPEIIIGEIDHTQLALHSQREIRQLSAIIQKMRLAA
ncbi:response regulator receiver protein [Magnetococcus marinus MC-1]|uniref:Response regulator receiver protein n=1 Tax=Magnetococcus marinus (strain ATCC BAA-1437 / JCM 17883 / MC-1) TaxID=156889 RepID=A0L7C8_MAGMM|nr:response regulator [Magnetococcus marinus]ABK43871.1 response regulator receiver protein [Magnetococcus marinus MC-1]